MTQQLYHFHKNAIVSKLVYVAIKIIDFFRKFRTYFVATKKMIITNSWADKKTHYMKNEKKKIDKEIYRMKHNLLNENKSWSAFVHIFAEKQSYKPHIARGFGLLDVGKHSAL